MKDNEGKDAKAASTPPAPDDDPRLFNLRNFGWFTAFLVGMIAFIFLSAALLSGFFLPDHSITVPQAPTIAPPEPRLQPNPAEDFQAFRATQQAGLDSYGWIDQGKGIVHIPIERAMERVAQSNLPVMTGTPVPLTPGAP